jgi:hypothetical protein
MAGDTKERAVPFGPYEGRPVEEVAVMDPDYVADLVVAGAGPEWLRAAGAQALLARPRGRLAGVEGRPFVLVVLAGLLSATLAGCILGLWAREARAPAARIAGQVPPTPLAQIPRPGLTAAPVAVAAVAPGSVMSATASLTETAGAGQPCGRRMAGAVGPDAAASLVGTFQAVEYRVAGTKDTGRVTYLNSRVPYRGAFYVAVFPGDYDRFPRPPAELFLGRCVVVQGMIELYRETPEIVLRSPDDIRILDDPIWSPQGPP